MTRNSWLSTFAGFLVLPLLSSCGGSSSNNAAPVVRGDPLTTQRNNFPTVSVTFPAELSLIFARDLDINSDDPQTNIRAAIFTDEDQESFELVCQLTVFVSDIDSSEQAYLSLFEMQTIGVISTDPIRNDGRSGIEILYTDSQDDGTALTGQAHAFYFNADVDNLVRSSTFVIECIATTQTFNNRRTLIDQVLDSVEFGTDVTGRIEANSFSISETGNIASRSE